VEGVDTILMAAAGILISALAVAEQLFDDVGIPPEAGEVVARFHTFKEKLESKSANLD
jgi:hypothetical protein